MIEERDPFFQTVSDYFILRRGKGVVLSSADHERLRQWREAGVHRLEVLEAVDMAFRKSRKAPVSFAYVAPFLENTGESEADEIDDLLGESDHSPDDDDADESLFEVLEALELTLVRWERSEDLATPARHAARELREELESLQREDSGIDSETLLILDDAFALNVYRALDRAEQKRVETVMNNASQRPVGDARDRPELLRDALSTMMELPSENLADVVARAMTASR
jgi:hypothetical protein